MRKRSCRLSKYRKYQCFGDVTLPQTERNEDGHAQERSLLDKVLKTVMNKDLWIANRHFCTQNFLFGIHLKAALFGFCLALVAFNLYALVMASLRAAHPNRY